MSTTAPERTWRYSRARFVGPVGALAVIGFCVLALADVGELKRWQVVVVPVALVLLLPQAMLMWRRLRAPREFAVEKGVLVARWRRRQEMVPLKEIVVHHRPSVVFESAVELETPKGHFVIFEDIEDFADLMSALGQSSDGSQFESA